ncbi:hypothetical protein SynPROS91_01140 [Synechococcus sp. PROS-9-1]|nr:hypothetical protein SynPROS91_01140 [Synechococcus sp. PROS-9-1]
MMKAEATESRQAAINVLQMIKHKEYMRKVRNEALRSQYINPREITG